MSLGSASRVADWLTVQNGRLLVHTGKVDIGQRISTALVQIAHEELTVAPEQIDIAPVRTGHAPDEGMTSGSNSVEQSGNAVRRAAATLRMHIIRLAVDRFGGAPQDWIIEDGTLCLAQTNHRIDMLDLAGQIGGDIKVDLTADCLERSTATLPSPAMRGMSDLVTGRYRFVQDLDVPGMQHARVIRPPHARARLANLSPRADELATRAGLRLIVDGSFVALVGTPEWSVVKTAFLIAGHCEWNLRGGLHDFDVFSRLNADHAERLFVVEGTPTKAEIPSPLKAPDLCARYERPYQMHGALAPSAAMAVWAKGTLTLHSHSQGIYPLRESIAESLGLDQAQVDITHVPGSGCYGHNGADDAAFEAALIALAMPDTPILLKWTREDEHRWEPYAPPMAMDLMGTLADGRVVDYSAEVFSDTHRARPRAGPDKAGPAKLLANRFRADTVEPHPATPNMAKQAGIHRNLEPIYKFAHTRLVKNLVPDISHRTSAMRCLGAAGNVFALECFMDELAGQAGLDPIAFRRQHLTKRRDLDVLGALADQCATSPKSMGRGVAYAQYKNSMARVGIAVDIDINDRAEISLINAEIVADAGRVVDGEGLRAQLEGGFIQAASWALYEQVQWDQTGILSLDWDSYPVIRFDNIPKFNVTILDQPDDASLGAGEASPSPTIAAIANAVFDATGLRLRRMPFTPEAILETARTT